MQEDIKYLTISLPFDENQKLKIYSEKDNDSLVAINYEEAIENCESQYQISEGHSYEFFFEAENNISDKYTLKEIPRIVKV